MLWQCLRTESKIESTEKDDVLEKIENKKRVCIAVGTRGVVDLYLFSELHPTSLSKDRGYVHPRDHMRRLRGRHRIIRFEYTFNLFKLEFLRCLDHIYCLSHHGMKTHLPLSHHWCCERFQVLVG